MNNPAEYDAQYFPGAENRMIRYYFYLNTGLNVLNQFRNLFLGIIGLYFVLKLDNWWILVGMFIPSIIALTIMGYYSIHRMNKITEWLGVRFGTHYALTQFNIQQNILKTLEEIKAKL